MTLVLCPLISQNQLPLANGFLEDIENNEFQYWSHQANEGGEATYSIETNDLVGGSTKALKCEVHSLGANGWHVSSKSEYPCLLYTSPSPRDLSTSRMPSSA